MAQIQKWSLFFELLAKVKQKHNILEENMWNMDEHGTCLGVCTNSTVIARAGKKRSYIKRPQSREWASILETISSTGVSIRPLIIFTGQNAQTTWFEEGDIPDYVYTTSDNAWTSSDIAISWLKDIFLPETTPEADEWRLLLLDGHKTHIPFDFTAECWEHKVRPFYFPPHATHLLQPLDLSFFSPLKVRYRRIINDLSELDDAAPVKKKRFISAYKLAREMTIQRQCVLGGWRASGICPWNPQKALNSTKYTMNP